MSKLRRYLSRNGSFGSSASHTMIQKPTGNPQPCRTRARHLLRFFTRLCSTVFQMPENCLRICHKVQIALPGSAEAILLERHTTPLSPPCKRHRRIGNAPACRIHPPGVQNGDRAQKHCNVRGLWFLRSTAVCLDMHNQPPEIPRVHRESEYHCGIGFAHLASIQARNRLHRFTNVGAGVFENRSVAVVKGAGEISRAISTCCC